MRGFHFAAEEITNRISRTFTDRMYQAGLFLDVPLIDHLIIDEEKYFSFADSHLLAKIRMSTKYRLPYKEEEERLKKVGRKEKAIEMAKALRKQGVDVNVNCSCFRAFS